MKLNSKNLPTFLRLLLLCIIIGTVAWELLARLVALAGTDISLAVGPIGFDVHVLAMAIMVNPGSLLGIVPAVALFRRL